MRVSWILRVACRLVGRMAALLVIATLIGVTELEMDPVPGHLMGGGDIVGTPRQPNGVADGKKVM